MRCLEFSGKKALSVPKHLWHQDRELFLLREWSAASLKCKEVGLVNFNWPFCFYNLLMNAVEYIMFGFLKGSTKSQFSITMWLHFHNKTFIIYLIDFQAFRGLIQLLISSLYVISYHPTPSYHIPLFFHSIQSHFIPPFSTAVAYLLCTKHFGVLWNGRWHRHCKNLQGA